MTHSQRSKRLRYVPPEAGVFATEVVTLLQRNEGWAWPASEIVRALDLGERTVWFAVGRLLQLGLVEKRSGDSFIRIRLTAAGRRYRPRRRR